MSIYKLNTSSMEDADTYAMLLKFHLNISNITSRLLVNRGITDIAQAQAFLEPSLDQLCDPFGLSGMDIAVERIRRAVASEEHIVVYGDYDVDGITSSTILTLYLRSLGARVDVYIPSRHDEGYGLHRDALNNIKEQGAQLVITVDCGITASDDAINIPGLDIIITDHHTPEVVIPKACAVINPKISGQAYQFTDLAGVGVTAKLIQALGGMEALVDYLDLVAIGTIADIVPLVNENRVFAALGLERINNEPRPGIKALLDALGIEGAVDSGKISYTIAPCLNAPGRMSTYHKGYELLTANSVSAALPVALELIEQNKNRRAIEGEILKQAKDKIPEQADLSKDRVLVICGEGWHPGVIGIVASRITEQYNRPSVIISLDKGQGVGSARGVKGFDLYNALNRCKDLFIKFGGHEQAAGLSIPEENIQDFRVRLTAIANEIISDGALVPQYNYDGQLTPEDITPNLHKEIDMLAPFGFGNPTPKFLLPSALIQNSRLIGKDANHLKLAVALGQRSWDAIGFGMAEADKELQQGCKVSLLTSLKLNEWMGVSSTQFQIHSIKRVYSGEKDIIDLLDSFYFKYFNAFLSEYVYNNKCALLENHSTGQAFASIDARGVANYFKGSMVGTAILVNTLDGAKLLLKQFLEADLMENVSIRYNLPNQSDGIGRNVIILAPDYSAIPMEYYHSIMIPAAEHGLLRYDYRNAVHNDKYNYDIALEDRVDLNAYLKENFLLTREQLANVYKWLRSIIPGRDYWPDAGQLLDTYQQSTGSRLNGFQILLALEVFKELGFITLKTSSQHIRIECFKNPANRQLDDSGIYAFNKTWLNCCGVTV